MDMAAVLRETAGRRVGEQGEPDPAPEVLEVAEPAQQAKKKKKKKKKGGYAQIGSDSDDDIYGSEGVEMVDRPPATNPDLEEIAIEPAPEPASPAPRLLDVRRAAGPGSWTCGACTFVNGASAAACTMCRTPKPASAASNSQAAVASHPSAPAHPAVSTGPRRNNLPPAASRQFNAHPRQAANGVINGGQLDGRAERMRQQQNGNAPADNGAQAGRRRGGGLRRAFAGWGALGGAAQGPDDPRQIQMCGIFACCCPILGCLTICQFRNRWNNPDYPMSAAALKRVALFTMIGILFTLFTPMGGMGMFG